MLGSARRPMTAPARRNQAGARGATDAAATSGGIFRDVLIGAVPMVLIDCRYLTVSCLAGLITFHFHSVIERLRNPVQVFDAAGLTLFAVTGALKALSFGLAPITAIPAGYAHWHRRRYRTRRGPAGGVLRGGGTGRRGRGGRRRSPGTTVRA